MDPLTLLTIASAGVGVGSTIYNWFAGNTQLYDQRKRLRQQRDFAQGGLDLQRQNTYKQIGRQAGADIAGLATGGIIGTSAQGEVDAVRAERTQAVDLQFDQAQAELDMRFDNASSDLEAQGAQFNANALAGLLGVGLTGAAQIIKTAPLDRSTRATYGAPDLFGLRDKPFSQGGFRLLGNTTGTFSFQP